MTIEHRDITEANLHEMKGASTAAANTVPVANGTGSAVWQKVKVPQLQGLTTDSGVANKSVVSDGSNGFKLLQGPTYGSMTITNNGNNFAVVAVADTTFNTASQFSLFTGTGAPWLSENLKNLTFTTDRLTVPVTGIYKIDAYLNVNSYPSASAALAVRYRINGSTFGARKIVVKSGGAGAKDQIVGFGLIPLTAGDYVQLYMASDTTGNVIVSECNTMLILVEQTA